MLRLSPIVVSGDCVLLYESPKISHAVVVISGGIYSHKFGSFYHDEIIGAMYGSKVYAHSLVYQQHHWLIIMHPTPEQWSMSLRHRTQILYPTDIALVLAQLYVKPGSIVYESGTGSGSLSCAFVRTIAPYGHLHTFEFNEMRVKEAQNDFKQLGIADHVTVYLRDICGLGFPFMDFQVDAVFLDLPSPSEAPLIASLAKCLKPFGRICSFSPCMEQVSKMCIELAKNQFQEISVVECLERTFDIVSHVYQHANFKMGPLTEKPKLVTEVVATQTQLARGHTAFLTFATYRPKSI